MSKETKLQVEAIKNGTVIDHIPAQVGIKVLQLFDMHNSPTASDYWFELTVFGAWT